MDEIRSTYVDCAPALRRIHMPFASIGITRFAFGGFAVWQRHLAYVQQSCELEQRLRECLVHTGILPGPK